MKEGIPKAFPTTREREEGGFEGRHSQPQGRGRREVLKEGVPNHRGEGGGRF